MFSSKSDSLFAVKSNPFDLARMLRHFNEQYINYLNSSGGVVLASARSEQSNVGAVLSGEDDEENKYQGYKIVLNDPDLLDHLFEFLTSHHILCIKYHNWDANQSGITLAKVSLASAGLTSKDEGEYLFKLHEKLQSLLAQQEQMRHECKKGVSL